MQRPLICLTASVAQYFNRTILQHNSFILNRYYYMSIWLKIGNHTVQRNFYLLVSLTASVAYSCSNRSCRLWSSGRRPPARAEGSSLADRAPPSVSDLNKTGNGNMAISEVSMRVCLHRFRCTHFHVFPVYFFSCPLSEKSFIDLY